MGGVTRRVLRTWQLLGLAVKETWLPPSGPIPTSLHEQGSEWVCGQQRMLTIACSLMSGCG